MQSGYIARKPWRNKILTAFLFIVFVTSWSTKYVVAQDEYRPSAWIANVDPTDPLKDVNKLIANPMLFSTNPNWTVVEFSFSILGNHFLGPFKTEGNRLTRQQIELLKQHKGWAKVFIEDIKLKSGEKVISGKAVIYKITP